MSKSDTIAPHVPSKEQPGVTDGPFPASRGPRLPLDLPDDHPDVKAHKSAVRARMIDEFEKQQAKQATDAALADRFSTALAGVAADIAAELRAKVLGACHDRRDLENVEAVLNSAGLPR